MLFYYKSKERPQQRQVQPAGLLYSRENTYETETLALQMSKDIETAFGKEGSLLRKKPLIKDTYGESFRLLRGHNKYQYIWRRNPVQKNAEDSIAEFL